jgi:hypothetical protein
MRSGDAWSQWRAGQGLSQAAVVKAEKDPAAPPKADDLRERQLAMIATLKNDRAQREAARTQDNDWRRADPTRAPAPTLPGRRRQDRRQRAVAGCEVAAVVTQAKAGDEGQAGKMPKYVTESGYEEFEDARTRVGRNSPLPHKLWLVDVAGAKATELKLDVLPVSARTRWRRMRKAASSIR